MMLIFRRSVAVLLAAGCVGLAGAQNMPRADVAAPKLGPDGKIEARFKTLHESFLKRKKEGPIGLLFLGDSITEGWGQAHDIWESHYGKYRPANFGIAGDQTQHVLWRIANGELDGIHPKVVVLMIGTNNIPDTAENITRADKKIVQAIHQKLPHSRLLILGIFPRGADPKAPDVATIRRKIRTVNGALAKLDDGKKIRYLDLGPKFMDAQGKLPPDIMPDALHPNVKGYRIWANAMQPLLDKMMK